MKLFGPRPISEITLARQPDGSVCDPGSVRCEIVLTGDGEMLCWRVWGRDGARWIASRWRSPTENCQLPAFAGDAA